MACHCRGGVVKHDKYYIRPVVHGVHNTRDARGKECRIADEGEIQRVRLYAVYALSDGNVCAHAEAGIDHIKGLGVAQRVAADVSRINGLPAACGLLDGIERCSVGAACTKHRRPYGHLRRLGKLLLVAFNVHKIGQNALYGLGRVFACGLNGAVQLAVYPHIKAVLSAEEDKLPLDDGVKLLDTDDLVEAFEELERQPFGERIWRGDLQQLILVRAAVQRLAGVGIADAVSCDAEPSAAGKLIEAVIRQPVAKLGVALFYLAVVEVRGARKDDPAHRVLDKALGLMRLVFVSDLDRSAAVTDSCGGSEQHRCADLLRELEGVLYHLICLLGGRGVKDGQLCKLCEVSCILLGL